MSRLQYICILLAVGRDGVTASTNATSDASIENQEYQEAATAKIELLQYKSKQHNTGPRSVASLGGDHRFLLVRPCARFAGDGMSGLPRHRVTGECCGDSVCSASRFESFENCPRDCKDQAEESQKNHSVAVNPPTESSLFGVLQGVEHDVYHCSDGDEYQSTCSKDRNYSVWLDSLLDRAQAGTLPFELPPHGSTAVEFGCGKGQDSRNIASMAGYALTAVDVSTSAIEIAKNSTSQEMMGTGPGQIEYVAYDAMGLPDPKRQIDFFFDATVYCGLRHEYLARLHDVWSRLFTPGHTLVHIQCWNWEEREFLRSSGRPVPRTQRDMEADFEPIFDILHSESCEKNQDGPGWCFYMKLKPAEVRERLSQERLNMQQAARDGDIEFVRQNLDARSSELTDAEINTLKYIAIDNGHTPLMRYLTSVSPPKDDPFFNTVYGRDAEAATIQAEDAIDGAGGVAGREKVKHLKLDWERAEAELILQSRLDRLVEKTGATY